MNYDYCCSILLLYVVQVRHHIRPLTLNRDGSLPRLGSSNHTSRRTCVLVLLLYVTSSSKQQWNNETTSPTAVHPSSSWWNTRTNATKTKTEKLLAKTIKILVDKNPWLFIFVSLSHKKIKSQLTTSRTQHTTRVDQFASWKRHRAWKKEKRAYQVQPPKAFLSSYIKYRTRRIQHFQGRQFSPTLQLLRRTLFAGAPAPRLHMAVQLVATAGAAAQHRRAPMLGCRGPGDELLQGVCASRLDFSSTTDSSDLCCMEDGWDKESPAAPSKPCAVSCAAAAPAAVVACSGARSTSSDRAPLRRSRPGGPRCSFEGGTPREEKLDVLRNMFTTQEKFCPAGVSAAKALCHSVSPFVAERRRWFVAWKVR